MAFRVTHEVWLATESARIRDFVLMPRFWGWKWDDKRLLKELNDVGMGYTLDQVKELNDKLHKDGVVEDIGIMPEPATPETIAQAIATPEE